MKKLLIPTLLTLSSTPLICLVGCGDNQDKPEDHAFETCTWEYLSKNCTDLENGTITEEEFLNAFTLDGQAVTSMDQFIGKTKKVQLEHQDLDHDNDPSDYLNGNEVAQTIRVIGTCADDDTKYQVNVIDANNTKATFTFEFADFISDENGYSIATFWNDCANQNVSNDNYFDSSIRKNVCGLGNPTTSHWYLMDETTHTTNPLYEGKSVLDMLPDGLANSLKSPKNRFINVWQNGWTETPIDDKLFLLGDIEIEPEYGLDCEQGMKRYAYYPDNDDNSTRRLKKQIIGDDEALKDRVNLNQSDVLYQGGCYSYAGYDGADINHPEYGGYYWISSPQAINNVHGATYAVEPNGTVMCYIACYFAMPVAPAFCI